MRVAGSANTHKSVTVRREMTRKLILFHQQNKTPRYPQKIDEKYLNNLPDNGVPKDLKIVEVNSDEDMDAFDQGPPLHGKCAKDKFRFVGRPVKKREQEHVLRNSILEKDPFLDYPKLGNTAFSEWDIPWLGSLCFPHLFPGGRGPLGPRPFQRSATAALCTTSTSF